MKMKKLTTRHLAALFTAVLLLTVSACAFTVSAAATAPRGENASGSKAKASAPIRSDIVSATATATGVKLKWTLSLGADGYYVYRALPSEANFTRIKTINKPTTLTFTDKTAKSGQSYFYTIRAFKKSASGTVTEASYNSAGRQMIWLKPPTLSSAKDQKGRIRLTWTKSPGALGYLILRRTGIGGYAQVQRIVGSSTLKYDDMDVNEGTTYEYAVIAFRFSYRSVRKNSLKVTHQKSIPPRSENLSKTVYRAVLIGECIYDPDYYDPKYSLDDPSPNLYFSYNDLKAMQRMLNGLNYSSVVTRKDANRSQVLSAIRYGFAGADENDVSLFYYTGHGYQDASGTYAGAFDLVDGSALLIAELANALKDIPGTVVVLLDSCGSGAAIHDETDFSSMSSPVGSSSSGSTTYRSSFDPDRFNQQIINIFAAADKAPGAKTSELSTGKFRVITASQIGESSTELATSKYQGGAFTVGIVEGAGFSYNSSTHTAAMPADKNSDRKITLGEAYSYAAARVRKLTDGEQHVQRYPVGSKFVIYYR